MAKIIGNTTSTPMRVPDWSQTDPLKADYIKNKPDIAEAVTNALQAAKDSGEFRGDDGKSAYQYAVDAGYPGTEEEFAELLASVCVEFKTDETLSLVDGVLSVNTAAVAEPDNTLPITSEAVHTQIGNINALLHSI